MQFNEHLFKNIVICIMKNTVGISHTVTFRELNDTLYLADFRYYAHFKQSITSEFYVKCNGKTQSIHLKDILRELVQETILVTWKDATQTQVWQLKKQNISSSNNIIDAIQQDYIDKAFLEALNLLGNEKIGAKETIAQNMPLLVAEESHIIDYNLVFWENESILLISSENPILVSRKDAKYCPAWEKLKQSLHE